MSDSGKTVRTLDLSRMKRDGQKIVALTAYDALFASLVDAAGADVVLVGDSLNTVLCAEDIAPLTDTKVDSATEGTFMGSHLINGYRAVCRLWPYARLPRSYWTPVVSDVPTLLLSGGRDPVTPSEGAEEVASHLRHSVHVVVPNGGHGVGGPCIRAMIVRLVETASLEGLDTSCIEEVPPTRFRVPG